MGLDHEGEPALGGKAPSSGSTARLALPYDTTAVFILARERTYLVSPHLCNHLWYSPNSDIKEVRLRLDSN